MSDWRPADIALYSSLFDIASSLEGQRVSEVIVYLDCHDNDFSEQPNKYGKSLLNGVDLKISAEFYSIGNRFTNMGYGLAITQGRTNELEFVEENKSPIILTTSIAGQTIRDIRLYWLPIPFNGASGFYPQEIEIITENGFLLISSIEVNLGEVNTEFTDEILLIEDEQVANLLKIGRFGLRERGREYFKTFEGLLYAHNRKWC